MCYLNQEKNETSCKSGVGEARSKIAGMYCKLEQPFWKGLCEESEEREIVQ